MTADPIRWPPPGLERMQGDFGVLASRAALAGMLLVAPLLGVVGLVQDRGAFGPLGDAWWVLIALGIVGLAFALDALGRLFRILRRCRAALEQGYTPATLLRVLADRHRDMGFLLSGARHFSMVDAREREGLVTMRVAGWLLMCAAGIWLLAAMAVGLLAAARETIAPLPLQVIAFFPAGVLYAAGALTMLLQEDRVRRARRLWYKQPWSADLSEKEVREWQQVVGIGPEPTRKRGVRVAISGVVGLALIVVLPVLTLLPASAMGPILTAVSIPSFDRYGQRVMRGEAYRSYRVDGDVSISPQEAGTILHRLLYVGSSDGAGTGEREPDIRIERAWIPPTAPDENPMGFEPFLWGDSLLPRVAQGLSPDQRSYLDAVAGHPSLADFSRLAAATALDVGSARWALPFPESLTLATLPIPKFASFRDASRAQIAAAALAWTDGQEEAAEQRLREVISVGFLMADDGPTLIDNLIGYTLVDLGGTALGDLYRLSGQTGPAAELSRLRQVAERNATMARWSVPTSNDAWVRSLYTMTTDTTIARGLRWEYFINLATIAPCLSLNRIVFGVGDDYSSFVDEARASLVRWPSDEAIFELARYGWLGASSPAELGLLSRVARMYMHTGPSSCGRFVEHMQAAGTL